MIHRLTEEMHRMMSGGECLRALVSGLTGLPLSDGTGYVLASPDGNEIVSADIVDQFISEGWAELDAEGRCRITDEAKSLSYIGLLSDLP